MSSRLVHLVLAVSVVCFASLARAEVLISELMYHPQSELPAEEWVELYNSGAATVDLSGWKFTSGVEFTFPAGASISPGSYLVVTANPVTFHAKYPAVTRYVAAGGWTGQLSNSSNHLVLEDALAQKVDEVTYADDGDWAVRQKDVALDFGHRGWGWDSGADGFGKSLELVNVGFNNDVGQNWRASTGDGGTPGAANSVAANDIAPIILDVVHFPLVPKSTDAVSISAQVIDDAAANVAVVLHFRNDGAANWSATPMFDDGQHGDAAAGDGVFGATLPAQADGTIVEFYVEASDATSHKCTWPAPALDENGAADQTANCLYQVDDSVYAGAMPIYRIVMKAADKAELTQINTNKPAITGVDQTYSHAKMNATFISMDGTSSELRYLAGVRNRGNGSRSLQPQSYNVSFTNEQPWKGRASLNLNTQDTPYQLLGSALYRKAGLSAPESRQVQVRVNGANPASAAGAPSYGFFAANEVQDNDFADHHFPQDSSGDIYRGQRIEATTSPSGKTTLHGANLEYILPGAGEPLSQVELYKLNYFKHTNNSEDNWSDLISLTQALAKGQSGASVNDPITYDADYLSAVQAHVDVTEWMRFLAVNTFADNSETNIAMGDGDDYYLYFGVKDPRALFVPYDLDTILGRSSGSNSATHSIWRMTQAPASEGGGPQPLNAFMKHPQNAPIYFGELKRLLDGPFLPANFDPLVDEILGGVVNATVISSIKSFNLARHAYITAQVPLVINVTASQDASGTALTSQSGYPRTTSAVCKLIGVANAVNTRSVKVNGVEAVWSAWKAQWTANNVALAPGINRILIQAFDAADHETERLTYDVWFDDGTVATASGTLASNTTWTAAGGPYRVTANLIVPSGVTLTVEPGTTVYVASGAAIQVNGSGKINAVGTDSKRIVFAHEPGASGTTWGSLDFINTTVESVLSYVNFSDCGGTTIGGHNAQVHVNNAIVFFDHLYFPPTPVIEFISFDAASFIVQNSYFSTYSGTTGPESLHGVNGIMAGGHGIFRDNYFGHTYGFNDTIDFTGGNRPGPILQVIGNVFDGASDDHLDLDSTDAWIEGNVFMHAHRDPTRTDDVRDTSSAISGGVDNANVYNEWTIINNIFYDVDHVFMTKQGGRVAFIHNTVSHVAKENGAGLPTDIAFINWTDDGVALPPASAGSGAYVAYNIVQDCAVLQANYDPANHTVIMERNILPAPWTGAGSGNQVIDPRLNMSVLSGIPVANVTAAELRQAFQLLPGSPAIGTGIGGRNLGGLGAHGVTVFGEPNGKTNSTTATLTVAPGGTFNWGTIPTFAWGWTAFKWKLDDGPWSSEIPVNNPPPFNTPPAINLTGLSNGPHTIYVTGKNDVGYYQDDPFLYPATSSVPGAVTVSKTWTVDTAYVPPAAQPLVRINEVLARNTETQGFSGTFPDIIELYNAGNATADISGWGLTDNAALPYKYTIPAGTTLAPGTYLVIYASNSANVPQPKTGFGLKDSGDTLTLTRSAAANGGVADSVPFGAQLPDYSIGRRPADGVWDLCRPTFGAANVVVAQGSAQGVKINEWLADARTLFGQDFIELFNPGTLPVNVGNCYLTDNPVEWTTKHQIRELTFIASAGYISFKADGDADQGADHVGFKLSPLQGEIGLFSPSQDPIDNVVYGPQSTDVSQGRTPNGASTLTFFNQPTPGAPNPGSIGGGTPTTTTVNLLPINQAWKYRSTGSDHDADFIPVSFDDSAWALGAQLLYIEPDALTSASGFVKTTTLPADTANSNLPYNATYFRTHFNYSGPLTGVTLTATIMCDDGCVIYLNGQEAKRVRMPTGTITFATVASANVNNAVEETISIPATALVQGDNVLAVAVHQQHSGTTQTSSDVVWGMKLDAVITNTAASSSAVLNEVLVTNTTVQNPSGSYAGWIEFFNPGTNPVSVADMSLSNEVGSPRKWVFPAGTSVPANGYLVIECNGLAAASATNTGFALNPTGDTVYVFKALAEGGGLHDSVAFGRQVPDFSIGRIANGSGPFTLNLPTRGGLNSAAGLGAISSVKINEWLANPSAQPGWFELFNTGAQPVLLSGNFFTDSLGNRTKYLVPPLTFVGGAGASRWQQWIADNDGIATPGHVNFALNPTGESIGIFSGTGVQLDAVSFGSQSSDVSQGRFPDGASTIISMPPTPSVANQQMLPDSDGDGIPDSWETLHGLNPSNPADAALDFDGDGQSNLAEYLAGTDPRDATQLFRANVSAGVTPGERVIRFTAQTGHTYSVQYKNSLSDTSWSKLTDVSAPTATQQVEVTDASLTGRAQRFYRIITPAQP